MDKTPPIFTEVQSELLRHQGKRGRAGSVAVSAEGQTEGTLMCAKSDDVFPGFAVSAVWTSPSQGFDAIKIVKKPDTGGAGPLNLEQNGGDVYEKARQVPPERLTADTIAFIKNRLFEKVLPNEVYEELEAMGFEFVKRETITTRYVHDEPNVVYEFRHTEQPLELKLETFTTRDAEGRRQLYWSCGFSISDPALARKSNLQAAPISARNGAATDLMPAIKEWKVILENKIAQARAQ